MFDYERTWGGEWGVTSFLMITMSNGTIVAYSEKYYISWWLAETTAWTTLSPTYLVTLAWQIRSSHKIEGLVKKIREYRANLFTNLLAKHRDNYRQRGGRYLVPRIYSWGIATIVSSVKTLCKSVKLPIRQCKLSQPWKDVS